MSRYEKYKDSGIAWIGEIPAGWGVNRHKQVMRKIKHIKEVYDNENIISLSKKGVIIRDLDAGGKMPTSFDGYQKVYAGNLLMCLFDIDVTPRCVGLIKDDGLSSPAYSQFILSRRGYAPYYDYLLRYMDDEKTLLHLSKNLRSSLTEDDFSQINTIVPTLAEQEAIAEFLDGKCEEVDRLVGLQQAMIEELVAYKQSVITECVTKGLDPTAPLRDSGIPWIGSIPAHWEVKPFKTIYRLGKGLTITKADLTRDGIAVINYGQIHSKLNTGTAIQDSLIKYVPEKYLGTDTKSLVFEGDIIFADTSEDLDGCGNCIYMDRVMELFAGYHTIIARNTSGYVNKFLPYLFKTDLWRGQLRTSVSGVKVLSISQKILASTTVIIPPLQEQQAIADHLDRKCEEIDNLISIKREKIEQLKEYKKSIIFEYVTGKKRVMQ